MGIEEKNNFTFKLALRFLPAICPPHLCDEIECDLF